LKILNHFSAREIPRAIEGHVLQKVSHALLVIHFHQGTHVHVKPETRPARRLIIRQNDVTQSVV
jgi:ATP-dependent Clp protease ATP-binding subunit ClpA